MARRGFNLTTGLLLCCVGGTGACADPVLVDRTLAIAATGTVIGTAFVDLDESGTPSSADLPYPGLTIQLVPVGGGGVVASAKTDTKGVFAFDSVPVGTFRAIADGKSLPDTFQVQGQDTTAFPLALGDTVTRHFRLSFPLFSIAEVRALPPGRRVATKGIALNSRVPFGDGVVHIKAGSSYLRATRVDRSGFQPGDSVRFVGRTATDAGQPILDDVRPAILLTQAELVRPVDVTSFEAAGARARVLDAALVRIRNARIVDTVSAGADLLVTANDGSGPVTIVLRDFLGFDRTRFRPGPTVLTEATGLLVPFVTTGGVTWRLNPRAPADLSFGTVQTPQTCVTPTSACMERVAVVSGAFLRVLRTHPLQRADPNLTRALIIVHGASRDVGNYFDIGNLVTNAVGEAANTIVIAPHFLAAADGPAPDEAFWTSDNNWRSAYLSEPGPSPQISSFAAMDRIIQILSDRTLFPSLSQIVIAGHSEGAGLAHRMAATSRSDETHAGIRFRYVVVNPPLYSYPRSEREGGGVFVIPDPAPCPTYDNWHYGLAARNAYANASPADTLRARLVRRDVRLLLGSADTLTAGIDVSCGANLQGRNILNRGLAMVRFMARFFPGHRHVDRIVPGVAHQAREMFASPQGVTALFGP